MKDDVTASDDASSPIGCTDAVMDDLSRLANYAADLIRGGYLFEAIGEIERTVFALDQPRGLSAAEPPCCEAVINNPVDPTPGERGE